MRKTICVCTLPRSGGNLLDDLFTANGVIALGESLYNYHVLQKFNSGSRYNYILGDENFSLERMKSFLDHWYKKGNDTVVIRMMDWAIQRLLGTITEQDFQEIFGEISYIRLIRQDTWKQAISIFIADQTKVWYRKKGSAPEDRSQVVYDFSKIKQQKDRVDLGNYFWADFIKHRQIQPFNLVYEDLANNYQQQMAKVFDFLQIKCDSINNGYSEPQTDSLNQEFYNRVITTLSS